jgi:hypothetical protein
MAASLGSGFGPLTARSVHLCIMQLVFAAPTVTAGHVDDQRFARAKRGE